MTTDDVAADVYDTIGAAWDAAATYRSRAQQFFDTVAAYESGSADAADVEKTMYTAVEAEKEFSHRSQEIDDYIEDMDIAISRPFIPDFEDAEQLAEELGYDRVPTPSTLPPDELAVLIDYAHDHPDIELTRRERSISTLKEFLDEIHLEEDVEPDTDPDIAQQAPWRQVLVAEEPDGDWRQVFTALTDRYRDLEYIQETSYAITLWYDPDFVEDPPGEVVIPHEQAQTIREEFDTTPEEVRLEIDEAYAERMQQLEESRQEDLAALDDSLEER